MMEPGSEVGIDSREFSTLVAKKPAMVRVLLRQMTRGLSKLFLTLFDC